MSIKITRDGRTIRSGKDYTDFRREMFWRQNARCCICSACVFLTAPLENDRSFHIDHIRGRGLGGSKRDDTLESCQGLCGRCHRIKHNQQEKVPSKLHWSK